MAFGGKAFASNANSLGSAQEKAKVIGTAHERMGRKNFPDSEEPASEAELRAATVTDLQL